MTGNITGRAAHAGLEPENGISAIIIAAEILTRLPLGRIDAETTSNVGRIEGGLKRNIIPEQAFIDGEIRSLDNRKLDYYSQQFQQVFQEAADRHPKARVSLDITNTYQAYSIDVNHPTVLMIGQSLERIGLELSTGTTGGGSDANIFVENGIIALPVGIGGPFFPHNQRDRPYLRSAPGSRNVPTDDTGGIAAAGLSPSTLVDGPIQRHA